MTTRDKKLVDALIHSVGLKNNLRDSEVLEIVESQFRFIYETIMKLELEELELEEVEKLKTNFILKNLGKIYTSTDKVQKVRNRKSYIKQLELKKNGAN